MDSLSDAYSQYMPHIDKYLSDREIPIHARPVQSSMLFTDWFVKKVFTTNEILFEPTEDTEKNIDYIHAPWFAFVYHECRKWYVEHYGEMVERRGERFASGVIVIRGVAVEMRVPLTTSTPETPGETLWLGFPSEVGEDEDPLEWLVNPPLLNMLEKGQFHKARRAAISISRGLRSINIGLMSVNKNAPNVAPLLDGVLPLFETAATSIIRDDDRARGDALWNCQMALEKTLKALASQRLGEFKETHDLYDLLKDVAPFSPSVKPSRLSHFPKKNEIIDFRYGLNGKPSLAYTVKAYGDALGIASDLAACFEHSVNISGAKFLIQKLPFLTLPE